MIRALELTKILEYRQAVSGTRNTAIVWRFGSCVQRFDTQAIRHLTLINSKKYGSTEEGARSMGYSESIEEDDIEDREPRDGCRENTDIGREREEQTERRV